MHADEVDIDAQLVGRLMAEQFPWWAELPINSVPSTGTVNAIFRLGEHLYARLSRLETWVRHLDKEWEWLPKLAPHLSLRVPEPVAQGRSTASYPLLLGDLPVDRRSGVSGRDRRR
jgi:aminoglycoside phosphotransferase (APT) family kinase protein